MTLAELVKHAQKMIKEDPKLAQAEVRLSQYDDIYHDSNGTSSCNQIEVRYNKIHLG